MGGSELSDDDGGRSGSYSFSADVSESEESCIGSFAAYGDDVGFSGNGVGSSSQASSSHLSCCFLHSGAGNFGPLPFNGTSILTDGGGDEEPGGKGTVDPAEIELMKERFAKLLLGEDMSGRGKGVCTALAISNAITNLYAAVFSELWRLEPLSSQKKDLWKKEMQWLLCVSDSIVELIPSLQEFPGGKTVEVMITRPRSDLNVSLPALKKLDAMLIGILDSFQETEFWYVDQGVVVDDVKMRYHQRQEDKWWLPCPQVPPGGMSVDARKKLQHSKDCVAQIFKASLSINNSVLAEMEIPDIYFESLPKSGKACLGDIIYRYISTDQFSSDCLFDFLETSSHFQTLDIVDGIEAAVHVWRRKCYKSHSHSMKGSKNEWGAKVKSLVGDADKTHHLLNRAEILLQSLKNRFPHLSQTLLDSHKIQYNKDVGRSILESYSRVLEALAFNIIARIDDLIFVDDACKRSAADSVPLLRHGGRGPFPIQKRISPSPFSIQNTPYASPFSTPQFCLSPMNNNSERSAESPLRKCQQHNYLRKEKVQIRWNIKVEKSVSADGGRTWACPGNLGVGKDVGTAPERD